MSETKEKDVSSVILARETRDTAKLGEPSKFLQIQKFFLVIFAILVAGLLQLLIVLIFENS
ncbi:MAG: hypothetical protein ACXAD7_04265 [Candidatus Kariarchaeaceae archaeon]|jgi:hypothetical protein